MASNGCNFCGKVGIQPISNERTTFNYSCLEVKNKKSNKADKADQQRSSIKVKSPFQEEFQVKNEMRELGSEGKDIMHNVLSFFFKTCFWNLLHKCLCPQTCNCSHRGFLIAKERERISGLPKKLKQQTS